MAISVIYSNSEATFDAAISHLRWDEMSRLRGILMLIASGFAFYRGWTMQPGHHAVLAYGLGTLALALAVWHLMQAGRSKRI